MADIARGGAERGGHLDRGGQGPPERRGRCVQQRRLGRRVAGTGEWQPVAVALTASAAGAGRRGGRRAGRRGGRSCRRARDTLPDVLHGSLGQGSAGFCGRIGGSGTRDRAQGSGAATRTGPRSTDDVAQGSPQEHLAGLGPIGTGPGPARPAAVTDPAKLASRENWPPIRDRSTTPKPVLVLRREPSRACQCAIRAPKAANSLEVQVWPRTERPSLDRAAPTVRNEGRARSSGRYTQPTDIPAARPAPSTPPEEPFHMHVRVLTDQPWEVAADVLAVPFVGDLAFDGPWAELDRRTGGELKALVAFGEVSTKQFHSTLAAGRRAARLARRRDLRRGGRRDRPRGRSIRIGASIERRLGGRTVNAPRDLAGGPARASRRRRRGRRRAPHPRRRRGDVRAAGHLPRQRRDRAAGPRRARSSSRPARMPRRWPRPPSAAGSSARAPTPPGRSPTAPRTTSTRSSSPTRPGPSPSATACGSTSSSPTAPASSAWACSWPWARGATTRPG